MYSALVYKQWKKVINSIVQYRKNLLRPNRKRPEKIHFWKVSVLAGVFEQDPDLLPFNAEFRHRHVRLEKVYCEYFYSGSIDFKKVVMVLI